MVRRLHVPLLKPEDVIPHLAKQEAHWRTGYSAQELAVAWSKAGNDFPRSVRKALNTAPEYVDAEFVDSFFEREVELGSPGRNSQTDLMAIAGLHDGLAIIAVEGKMEESFAELVANWNGTPASSDVSMVFVRLSSSTCQESEVSVINSFIERPRLSTKQRDIDAGTP